MDALHAAGYTLIREIGSGAFSRVYLATEHALSNRYVVLKISERDFEETDRLALLQHTNIVPVFSCRRIHRHSVVCMPYTGSVTLADYLSRHKESKRTGQSLVVTVRQASTIPSTKIRIPNRVKATTW